MTKILETVNAALWGAPALVLILGVGVYLSAATGLVQLRLFGPALRRFAGQLTGSAGRKDSSFRSLCTALAATVGTGNLAGVAGAICLGGPGAVFWMWVCGFFGMATKYAEAVLAVRYQKVRQGELQGGPMYYICARFGPAGKRAAGCYCLFGVLASFGVGNAAQINTLCAGIGSAAARSGWELSDGTRLLLGLLLAMLILAALLGGSGRIGAAAEKLIPAAAGGYLLMCLAVLLVRSSAVPGALRAIFTGAFSPEAVTGGAVGSGFRALRTGCSRGVFSNEAGMGTAAIAHGGAQVFHPVQQGMMGIVEVFADTILICTLTALVILTSGVPVPYGTDAGAVLTEQAFCAVLGDWSGLFLTGALCCFAFVTVLGWGLYGGRCLEYLLGVPAWRGFALAQAVMAFAGALIPIGPVWLLADMFNGLMAIPNLIALAALSGEVRRLTIDYINPADGSAGGGTICRFPSMQTAASPLPCESSTPSRWKRSSRERKFTI